jgi:RNA-directed DNA polymerase
MSTQLDQIAGKAKSEPKLRFTSLAHLLTPEFLKETWKQMNRRGASGIDGETTKEFEQDLDTRVQDLCERLKQGAYRAPPVRRVEIPKGPGKVGTRPLGIPTVEDRLLQRAVARILEAVFEADFLECSYGFRPGRSPHDALRALRGIIVTKKVGHLYEADIRGYFNHIQHEWLQKMVAHRIGDPVILRLIGKWLNAGFMAGGVVTRTEEGSPQGGPISPILANIYLHYVLDLWFEKKATRMCEGEAYLTRFADDFVVNFQYRSDADRFAKSLTDRFGKFGLELAEEKTRLMRFGRFVRADLAKTGEKPDKFDFLGFTHVCGVDRGGKFALVRIPCVKSCRKFLAKTREWLKGHRHWKRRDQQRQLTTMLRGFYQYFGLHHCQRKLDVIRREVQLQWIRTLRRRSQRHRMYWSYLTSRSWFELPQAGSTRHATV